MRDKKHFVIIILSAALVISCIGYMLLLSTPHSFPIPPDELKTLRVGTMINPEERPWDFDPINAEDKRAIAVIDQVCEGLYMHDLSDPNLGINPHLAKDFGTWDSSKTQYTFQLKQNITFHDGTSFDGEAVKWNFERINWFINGTGTLNTTITHTHSLWKFLNGTTILNPKNPVTINSEYNVTINLRAPYAILESLLCNEIAFMLSPISTPRFEYINNRYGRIVGTGPFVYDYYIVDEQINLHRWKSYWKIGTYFEEIYFYFFSDSSSLLDAFLAQSIDYLLHVNFFMPLSGWPEHVTVHYSDLSFDYAYLGMNNHKINKTWRQAISYAIEYPYMIQLLFISAKRSNGPLTPNFPSYDPNIIAANWDLTKARQILVNAGITNLTANNDTTGPVADAWRSADLKSWNYSYPIWDDLREDFGVLLTDNLDLIGINVITQALPRDEFFNRIYGYNGPGGYDQLELYWAFWSPDFLSPYNMIVSLFSNLSISNSAQYYNHTVEMWLKQVLSETNIIKRNELYSKILHQIVEVDMPHVFGYHFYTTVTHSTYLRGIPYNSLYKFYAMPMYRT
jgi:peptide/nickel transport system substrate-binding protein